MKKITRRLICLTLVVLLVVACAITAMASSGRGTVISNGTKFPYTWSVYCTYSYGTASISTTDSPATVSVQAQNHLYNALNKAYGDGYVTYATGYGTATAKPGKIFSINGVLVSECSVVKTTGTFYVAGQYVAQAVDTAQ